MPRQKSLGTPLDYHALFEAAPGPILVLTPDHCVADANSAYCRAIGKDRAAMIGRPIAELFPDDPGSPRATVAAFRDALDRVLKSKRTEALPIQTYPLRRADGTVEQRSWSVINTPVLDADGEVLWILHRAEDVTALPLARAPEGQKGERQKEMQIVIENLHAVNRDLERSSEALRESEERFRTLANKLPGIVYRRLMTPDGKFRDLYFSDGLQKILGIDPTPLLRGDKSMMDFLSPEDRERAFTALSNAAAKEQSLTIEVRQLTEPDKRVRWFQYHTTPTRLPNGDVQWDGIGLDVTDRKATERQLQHAVKMDAIGQLTGGVAHDFNNLLTIILGNAELLVDALKDNANLREIAKVVENAADRGADLTKQLLAFARRQALEPKIIDANKLIAGMDGLLRRMLAENVEVEFVRGAGLWPALVDPAQLESAVLNLSINARDAMPEGGKLTIETANTRIDEDYSAAHDEVNPGQYVLIGITDSGTGMTPDVMARAFDPFFSTKEVGKGTGLGLSMVYGFVKQSGGHIKIYSEVGYGTTIKMYLPRAIDADRAEDETAREAGAEPRGRETILVVEDDEGVRRHADVLLRSLGYTVLTAENGPKALTVIERGQPFDLLFTDVVMPGGMSGRQLADAAQKMRPGLKVLFTSGYTENAIVHQGRLDPGVHLIRKPYRRRDLALKIREVIDGPKGGRIA